MRSGYRLITTTYRYYPNIDDAKIAALKDRGEGKKTEIITEADYQQNHMEPMQDLTKI